MIVIKCGTYGAKDGMKRAGDGPFSLSEKEEARLVERGVAEYVACANAPQLIGFDETPPGGGEVAETESASSDEPLNFGAMTAKKLRELGSELGLSFPVTMSKEKMIEAIEAAIAEPDEEEPDAEGEEEPDEAAPVFNAAEAVQ